VAVGEEGFEALGCICVGCRTDAGGPAGGVSGEGIGLGAKADGGSGARRGPLAGNADDVDDVVSTEGTEIDGMGSAETRAGGAIGVTGAPVGGNGCGTEAPPFEGSGDTDGEKPGGAGTGPAEVVGETGGTCGADMFGSI